MYFTNKADSQDILYPVFINAFMAALSRKPRRHRKQYLAQAQADMRAKPLDVVIKKWESFILVGISTH